MASRLTGAGPAVGHQAQPAQSGARPLPQAGRPSWPPQELSRSPSLPASLGQRQSAPAGQRSCNRVRRSCQGAGQIFATTSTALWRGRSVNTVGRPTPGAPVPARRAGGLGPFGALPRAACCPRWSEPLIESQAWSYRHRPEGRGRTWESWSALAPLRAAHVRDLHFPLTRRSHKARVHPGDSLPRRELQELPGGFAACAASAEVTDAALWRSAIPDRAALLRSQSPPPQ